jgi:hypothetical protein
MPPRRPIKPKVKTKTSDRIKQKKLPTLKSEKEAIEQFKKHIKKSFNKKE